nr:hypothetical protein HK105_003340 [Polyrhizophydium stewartii]
MIADGNSNGNPQIHNPDSIAPSQPTDRTPPAGARLREDDSRSLFARNGVLLLASVGGFVGLLLLVVGVAVVRRSAARRGWHRRRSSSLAPLRCRSDSGTGAGAELREVLGMRRATGTTFDLSVLSSASGVSSSATVSAHSASVHSAAAAADTAASAFPSGHSATAQSFGYSRASAASSTSALPQTGAALSQSEAAGGSVRSLSVLARKLKTAAQQTVFKPGKERPRGRRRSAADLPGILLAPPPLVVVDAPLALLTPRAGPDALTLARTPSPVPSSADRSFAASDGGGGCDGGGLAPAGGRHAAIHAAALAQQRQHQQHQQQHVLLLPAAAAAALAAMLPDALAPGDGDFALEDAYSDAGTPTDASAHGTLARRNPSVSSRGSALPREPALDRRAPLLAARSRADLRAGDRAGRLERRPSAATTASPRRHSADSARSAASAASAASADSLSRYLDS